MYLLDHLVVRAAASARVTRKRRRTATGPLSFSPGRPIAAALGERRAYCSGASVFEAGIADQRSSKLAVGSSFASTVRPFILAVPAGTEIPSIPGECDLMLTAVAATASRATATNPVIVRCLVISTSYCSPKSLSVGHENFAKVQQMRQDGLREACRRTAKLSQIQTAAQTGLVYL